MQCFHTQVCADVCVYLYISKRNIVHFFLPFPCFLKPFQVVVQSCTVLVSFSFLGDQSQ